jgi:shikimate dehydrogenase
MSGWFTPRSDRTPYYCVVGHPIAHSKSPQIHAAFATQTGRQLVYERVDVLPGNLAAAVAEFRACGGRGLNVTVPMKEEAWSIAARREPNAELAGAANTLWFDSDGRIVADNTDGVGLVRDLKQNHGVVIHGRRLILLGAGGAARGVMPALLAEQPREILISNRTAARAAVLAKHFCAAPNIGVLEWGGAPTQSADVIINATAASLVDELPKLHSAALHTKTVCYDMMYGSTPTAFISWACSRGIETAFDGLGMLVEQAAAAFAIWHGIVPSTAPVIAALRSRLAC